MPTTRLAPSPTGALHLGNARTFLVNWLLARQNNWKILLRIEDLDGPRVKSGADQLALDDLRWLNLDWDTGPVYQSPRADAYNAAVSQLVDSGHAYPCICSRKEIDLAASAPHAEDGSTIYPGVCRGRFASVAAATQAAGHSPAIRFLAPDQTIEFDDAFAGHRRFNAAADLGDFVIRKADGVAAYQLAVVVDDASANIDQVVRGNDLIDSTPRQILLYRTLGLASRIPQYTHLPLIVGQDGRRLAKRHGDTRIEYYRQHNVPPNRILALLARWCGIDAGDSVKHPADLLKTFSLARIPKEAIVFSPEDDTWLRKQ